MDRIDFGVFLAPFHEVGENPTLALERDLDLIALCDRLGFQEAWVGEHHSTGWETIASPEMFLAFAAERTRHIRLGTGAVSLPYHHPLMVADRIVMLDHLSRGRINFGVGPGGHVTDAVMLGLDPARLRDMMAESLDVIIRLLTDPSAYSHEGSWFRLVDAVLQLRPYQRPHPPIFVTSLESPAGMRLAGRTGAGVLQLALAKSTGAATDFRAQWAHTEEAAAEAGREADRRGWRLVMPVHIAETRREAIDQIREGGARHLLEYVEKTTGRPCPVPGPPDQVVEQMADRGAWVVGTPDDLVQVIDGMREATGGFGGLLVWGHEWAHTDHVHRSYELIARYVMPRVRGDLEGILESQRIAREKATDVHAMRAAATQAAKNVSPSS